MGATLAIEHWRNGLLKQGRYSLYVGWIHNAFGGGIAMIWDSAYLKSINATQAATIKRQWARIARLERRCEVQQQIIDRQDEEIRALIDPVQQAEKLFRG